MPPGTGAPRQASTRRRTGRAPRGSCRSAWCRSWRPLSWSPRSWPPSTPRWTHWACPPPAAALPPRHFLPAGSLTPSCLTARPRIRACAALWLPVRVLLARLCQTLPVLDVCLCPALHVAVPASAARPRSADALHAASACRARSMHALHSCAQLRSSRQSWLALLPVMRGGRARPAQFYESCWIKSLPTLTASVGIAWVCSRAPPRPS